MTGVHQTVFGDRKGNCWAACIASILDMPVDDVPNFCGEPEANENWFQDTDEWLKLRGFRIFMIQFPDDPKHVAFQFEAGVPLIVNGTSPRGDFCHVVIMSVNSEGDWEMLHDPHPSGDGIRERMRDVSLIVKA